VRWLSRMKDFMGENLEFITKALQIVQHHYPDRADVILICNAPSWFSFMWQLCKVG
jgi:hypothetical protein